MQVSRKVKVFFGGYVIKRRAEVLHWVVYNGDKAEGAEKTHGSH